MNFDPLEIKTGARRADLARAGLLPYWEEKWRAFSSRLLAARFNAVIMDFDGTVYDGGKLDDAVLDEKIAGLLSGLVASGLSLGFASGRGLSLRNALRATFDQKFWPRIYLAYQDGAEVGRLDDDTLPTPYSPYLENSLLAQARKKLEDIFAGWANPPGIRAENRLLGLRADLKSAEHVFAVCSEIAVPLGLKTFKSGRMVDVTLPKVSKRNLEPALENDGLAILAIGDAGAWPGNDCELLASPFGLGVGALSANPDCCWRITRGSGLDGTREILGRLRLEAGVMRFVP